MEKYKITITHNKATHYFEVADYPHHNNQHCKYKVFENSEFVASFEPDGQQCLHVCQNAGGLDNKLLDLLANKIELQVVHPVTKHLNRGAS